MKNTNLRKLVISGLMAAIVFVFTIVIRIPIAITGGYVNIGDAAVLLCSYLIGGVYGALAAGLGSALADLSAGYTIYAPATFIIKFLMVIVANIFYTKTFKEKRPVAMVLAGIFAEFIMVFGYFVFESIFLGLGLSAFAGVYGNVVQGGVCFIIATALGTVLVKQVKPKLLESY